jgi:hypothetical protein
MPSIWSHALIVVDIVSMKVFVWVLGQLFTWAVDPNGGILDSHLFFFDRYSDLAEYHRVKGRTAKADRLAAIAEAYFQAAPDDDEPEAAAMAMPLRPRMNTNAVSTTRVPKPPADEPSGGRRALHANRPPVRREHARVPVVRRFSRPLQTDNLSRLHASTPSTQTSSAFVITVS